MASRRMRSSPRGLKQARMTPAAPLLLLVVDRPATAWRHLRCANHKRELNLVGKYTRVPVLGLMLYGFTLAGTAGLERTRAVAAAVEVAMDSEQTPNQCSTIRDGLQFLASQRGSGGCFSLQRCSHKPRNRARAGRWIRDWMEASERGERSAAGRSRESGQRASPCHVGPKLTEFVSGLRRFGPSAKPPSLPSPEREAASDGRALASVLDPPADAGGVPLLDRAPWAVG